MDLSILRLFCLLGLSMVVFFGKGMKKFIISIAPLFVVVFILLWFSWGLNWVLAFFGAVLFIVLLAFMMAKWMEFVDKHFKD